MPKQVDKILSETKGCSLFTALHEVSIGSKKSCLKYSTHYPNS